MAGPVRRCCRVPLSPGFRTPPKHSGKQLFDHNYLLCERLCPGAPGDAASLAAGGTAPPADNNASSGYRQHLARVLVRRALEQAATPA